MDGDELTSSDHGPFLLLDATWRYASAMKKQLPQLEQCQKRRIPEGWRTAYPRRQTECQDPEKGLASIEAIFAAFLISGCPTEGILDEYYWKDEFLRKNQIKLN
jgi:pre-rRNA-processing protein TSR3